MINDLLNANRSDIIGGTILVITCVAAWLVLV